MQRTKDSSTSVWSSTKRIAAASWENPGAADEYVRFGDLHESFDGLIGNIQGTPGTAGDYAAQGSRAVLGFVKDAFLGVGELAYEGGKLAVSAQQNMTNPAAMYGQALDAQILAENVRLGNVTTGTMANGAMSTATNVGKAIIAPVTEPLAKGQYVEATTRGILEVGTLALTLLKFGKATKTGEAIAETSTANKTTKATETAETAANTNKATEATNTAKAPEPQGPNGNGGKVEKKVAVGKSLAEERAHVKKLSDEAAEAEKNGDLKLRDAKIAEARSFLKERVLDNPEIRNANKPQALIDRLDVSSPKDKSVFWSGNKDAAKKLAKEIDGTCLETTNGGRIIDDWKDLDKSFPGWAEDPPPNGFDFWGGISEKYASGAAGDVRVIQTTERAAQGGGYVWKNAEKAILDNSLKKGTVTQIINIVI